METISNNPYKNLEILASLMDDQFSIGGFRFGFNFIVDLIPWVGDIITTAIALYLVQVAVRNHVSRWVLFRMLGNIAIYFLVGLIPWVGDIFGAWWKPNRRNLKLLQNKLP